MENLLYIWDNQATIKNIKSNSIDIIITDPPYWQEISFNLNWVDFNFDKLNNHNEIIDKKEFFKNKKIKIMKNDKKEEFVEYDWNNQFKEWYRVLKNDTYVFMFWNLEAHSHWLNIMKTEWFKFKWYIVWNKKSWLWWDLFWSYKNNTELIAYYSKWKPKIVNPKETNEKELWKIKKRIWNIWEFWPMNWSIENTWHQTQKPIQIYKKILEECTKYNIIDDKKNIIALDPFAWSWTIFKSTTLLNINWIWLEIDDKYHIPDTFKTKDFYTKQIIENNLIIKKIICEW